MSDAKASRLALVVAIAVGLVTVAGGVLLWLGRSVTNGNDIFLWCLFTATSAAYVVSGVAIVRRAPAHVIGWLCLGAAFVLELGLTLSSYGIVAIKMHPGALPAPGLALVVAETTPLLTITAVVLILHLFPTGSPAGPRWRPFVVTTIAVQALMFFLDILSPHRVRNVWSDELSRAGVSALNPIGIRGVPATGVVYGALGALYWIGVVAAVVSLFVRRRRASADERLQLRWLAAVAGAALGWIVLMVPVLLLAGPDSPAGPAFWVVITPLVALGPPAAIGVGIVKYRLFDIDVVIRKTAVVAIIGVSLTALYLGVLALATLEPISRAVVGVALLVLTFNPIRRAARAIADRVAYGRRASSYEVLSQFSERIADTYADDDVLPRMAAILASGTRARMATVWLRVGDELRPAASSGEDPPHDALPIEHDRIPALHGDAVEIRHGGELLGAISVSMPANDPLDAARRTLIQDMASQAGLVLRNVRLIEELRASRQRLVAAQDEERRRIERNLHDGVQQQLVALNVQLGLLSKIAATDPEKAAGLASSLQAQATDALEDLRDLARGIYPPLLADEGLTVALESQARRAAIATDVASDDVGRYPRDVEAAVYFCVLEALNNVAKYAGATRATITLAQRDGHLSFTVADDGRGFDRTATSFGTGLQGMADRLDAIGGTLDVASAPGAGTTVIGSVPAPLRT